MNGRWKRAVAIVPAAAALVFLAGAAGKGASGGAYEVKGKYFETCACSVSCPCPSNKFLPTEGHCDALSLIHIDRGQAEGVPLDGLDIAMVIRSPHGEKVMDALSKGKMDLLTIYLDDDANERQRAVLPRLLGALFGTSPIEGSKPPSYAAISLKEMGDVAEISIAGGKTLTARIENIDTGAETHHGHELPKAGKTEAKRISLTNAAPFPWVREVTQGYSHTFKYDDHGRKWEYKDRNAFFGKFQTKGTLPTNGAAAKS